MQTKHSKDTNQPKNCVRYFPGACGPTAFGYQCKYSCNCDGMCDPWTGECEDENTQCKTHFYGPNCQGGKFESLYIFQTNLSGMFKDDCIDYPKKQGKKNNTVNNVKCVQ